jgi:hypothetical protein
MSVSSENPQGAGKEHQIQFDALQYVSSHPEAIVSHHPREGQGLSSGVGFDRRLQ